MARPKSYDRDVALRRACDAFWAHGYGALGVRAIEEQTGLNQFAIQREFGGKEGLLVETMCYYAESARKQALQSMMTGGVNAIVVFLRGLIADDSPTSSKWGCLLVNSDIENAAIGSARIKAVSSAYWRSLQDHFEAAVHQSIDSGEIVQTLDVADISAALVSAVMGVHTANRIAGSNQGGAALVRMMEAQIASWRI